MRLNDGRREWVVSLNRSYVGLFVPRLTWRRLENFSTNAVCLALASAPYDEGAYLREQASFVDAVNAAGTPP